jgi:hypothetical protein
MPILMLMLMLTSSLLWCPRPLFHFSAVSRYCIRSRITEAPGRVRWRDGWASCPAHLPGRHVGAEQHSDRQCVMRTLTRRSRFSRRMTQVRNACTRDLVHGYVCNSNCQPPQSSLKRSCLGLGAIQCGDTQTWTHMYARSSSVSGVVRPAHWWAVPGHDAWRLHRIVWRRPPSLAQGATTGVASRFWQRVGCLDFGAVATSLLRVLLSGMVSVMCVSVCVCACSRVVCLCERRESSCDEDVCTITRYEALMHEP